MKYLKLEEGQEVTINIPFTYTIGDEGYNSGLTLNTIEDCKEEVAAELDNGVVNSSDVFLEVERPMPKDEKLFNLLELSAELADRKLRETFNGQVDIETEDEVRYTEEAQDYFNELYDEYMTFLENL